MIFTFVDEILISRGLSMLPLAVLQPDNELYRVLCFQPKGDLDASRERIGNSNEESARRKHLSYLSIASHKNVELVLGPEYSCPWTVIETIVESNILPHEGNLWVLGCESITPDELTKLPGRYPTVEWIYEEIEPNSKSFFDPVCYFLKTREVATGIIKNTIVIQFKSQNMADRELDYIERDNMIRGSKGYILRNDNNSICLTTLICADSLIFEENMLPQQLYIPYIFLHPQLSYEPRHAAIRRYRNDAFVNNREREYLCINWARGSQVSAVGSIMTFGGSGYYTKSNDLMLTDGRVNSNHYKGLYYTRCHETRSHVYFLNYDELVFMFRTTKVSQAAVPGVLQHNRTGPEMLKVFGWDETSLEWSEQSRVSDDFAKLCEEEASDLEPLTNDDMQPLDKERLLTLSCGLIGEPLTPDWYNPIHLKFFRVNQDEIVRRLTFSQDPDVGANDERIRIVSLYGYLRNVILPNPAHYPMCIADLINNCRISYPWNADKYNYNLCRTDGNGPATGVYLGLSTQANARRIFDSMAAVLKEDNKRLVVWYQRDATILWEASPVPRIDDEIHDGRSINKEF